MEKMVKENFEDTIIIKNLAKLQQAHIFLNEKLNNLVAQRFSQIKGTAIE